MMAGSKKATWAVAFLGALLLVGCGREPTPRDMSPGSQGNSAPTAATAAANRAVAASLPLTDPSDLEDARRGFIAALPV